MKNNLVKSIFVILFLYMTNLSADDINIFQDSNVTNKIAGAVSGDIIRFYPGTYAVNIVLDNRNLRLEGMDTKNTILKSGNGVDPIIEVNGNGAISSVIQNFTFIESDTGIFVTSSTSGLTIINNVFTLGLANTALLIDENVNATVRNNTFYGNSVNLNSDSTGITLKNNIFESYDEFILGSTPDIVTYNCIEDSLTGLDDSNQVGVVADFVDETERDFHLKEDSPCIDKGEPEVDGTKVDMGAYGGDGFDNIPDSMDIEDVTSNDDFTSIQVEWPASTDYNVSGYKLYYRTEPIYSSAQDNFLTIASRDTAFISVVDTLELTSHTLLDLPIQPTQPLAPELTKIVPGKNKLKLFWTSVDNATSYVVNYVAGEEAEQLKDVGNVNSFELEGLSNDLVYKITIVAKNQLSYYFQVATYIGDPDDSEFAESYFVREDETLDVNAPVLSSESNAIFMQPEAVVPYPNLPNEGCFIATAAFGFYSAEQVQLLRNFRDNHLLTNDSGQAFVEWYYYYGPYAAAVINEYSFLKPITRVLLYPLIIAAQIIEVSAVGFYLFIGFIFIMLLLTVKAVFIHYRKRAIIT